MLTTGSSTFSLFAKKLVLTTGGGTRRERSIDHHHHLKCGHKKSTRRCGGGSGAADRAAVRLLLKSTTPSDYYQSVAAAALSAAVATPAVVVCAATADVDTGCCCCCCCARATSVRPRAAAKAVPFCVTATTISLCGARQKPIHRESPRKEQPCVVVPCADAASAAAAKAAPLCPLPCAPMFHFLHTTCAQHSKYHNRPSIPGVRSMDTCPAAHDSDGATLSRALTRMQAARKGSVGVSHSGAALATVRRRSSPRLAVRRGDVEEVGVLQRELQPRDGLSAQTRADARRQRVLNRAPNKRIGKHAMWRCSSAHNRCHFRTTGTHFTGSFAASGRQLAGPRGRTWRVAPIQRFRGVHVRES